MQSPKPWIAAAVGILQLGSASKPPALRTVLDSASVCQAVLIPETSRSGPAGRDQQGRNFERHALQSFRAEPFALARALWGPAPISERFASYAATNPVNPKLESGGGL